VHGKAKIRWLRKKKTLFEKAFNLSLDLSENQIVEKERISRREARLTANAMETCVGRDAAYVLGN